jgi:peptide/nickel transport system substrate-binding protein
MSQQMARAALAMLLLLSVTVPGRWTAPAAAQPKKGGILRVGLYNDVTSMDPGTSTNVPGIRVRNQIYETLLAWDKDINLQPMLADRYDVSADGLTYTFALRRGVKFHDGSTFSAEDVKFTFERLLKVSPRKSNLAMIEQIDVVDPHTVRFRLKQAGPLFLQGVALWFSQITPKQNTEQHLQKHGQILEPVGTGPYKVADWKRGQEIRLVRFGDYVPRPEPASGLAGQKIAYLDEVLYVPIKDNKIRMLSLEQGEVDYVQQVPPEEAQRLAADPAIEVKSVPGTNWSALYFNATLKPTSSKAMRQAIALSIDYDELNKAAFWGRGTVNNSLIPEAQAAWRTPEHKVGFKPDPQRVKQLLQESGYQGEELIFQTSNEPVYDLIAQNLQAQLKRAGINIKLNVLESAAHGASLYIRSSQNKAPTWHIGLLVSMAFRPDPDMHYYTRGHSSAHVGLWKNPGYDALVEKARAVQNFSERRRLYAQAHKLLLDEVPFIVLLDEPYIDAYRKSVKGAQVLDPHMDIFWGVWLAK